MCIRDRYIAAKCPHSPRSGGRGSPWDNARPGSVLHGCRPEMHPHGAGPVSYTHLDYESLQYFQRQLMDSGVIDRLVEMGVQENDTIRIDVYKRQAFTPRTRAWCRARASWMRSPSTRCWSLPAWEMCIRDSHKEAIYVLDKTNKRNIL